MAKLSIREKEKPYLLILAIFFGIALNRFIGKVAEELFILVYLGLFIVISSIMAGVEVKNVGRALKKIKPTSLALFINFVFNPAFAWFLGYLFLRSSPDLWAGVVLYALTPCIGWYLIFIDLAKGDVPLGVALLPWNITLQILLLPFYLYLLVGRVIPLDVLQLAKSVFTFLVLPFFVGHSVRYLVSNKKGAGFFSERVTPFLGEVKLWALVIVVIAMFASQESLSIEELSRVFVIIIAITIFFTSVFAVSTTASKLLGLSYKERVAVAFTTMARNSEAVIGVAVAAFPGHPLVYLAIIIGPAVELPVLVLFSKALLRSRKA